MGVMEDCAGCWRADRMDRWISINNVCGMGEVKMWIKLHTVEEERLE